MTRAGSDRSIVLTPLVIDCSVTVAWFLSDERSDGADRILDHVVNRSACVPTLWLIEVGNVLLVAERRRRISTTNRKRALNYLRDLPIVTEETSAQQAWGSMINLAETYRLSLWDATYLNLAMERGFPLASFDKALRAAAIECGVELLDG
ncbi:MAG: type II toxin-antitoxin system VapC family toxin [Rhodospirillales bacterium]|nr:type II toxin-antitoxin system VapC family toxin [Rhodospirillales bacterium]